MKFSKEGCFEFTVRMICTVVALEDFVDPLEKERPKSMKRAKVTNTWSNMRSKMMIWPNNIRAIKLFRNNINI